MKNLQPPHLNAEDVYISIKNRSKSQEKKTILHQRQEYVLNRYEEYITNTRSLESITSSDINSEDEKKAFTSCYSRNSKGYLEGEVVTQIIAVQSIQHKMKCPYCGMDKPRTIDHYLPKSEFPEFSIFPPNLIPCCGYCNNKKSDTWLWNGKRVFLNLYYDDIPADKQFLYARLEYENRNEIPTVTFSIENKENIPSELFDIILSHYHKLDLLKEFAENVEEFLSNIYDEIMHNPELSTEDHKSCLKRKYQTNIRKYGKNHWETSFLRAVLESEEFFEKSSNK